MVDGVALAERLNGDCYSAQIDRAALDDALRSEGENFFRAMSERPHLFSGVVFFISADQMKQMRAVIAAVESVVKLPAWRDAKGVLPYAPTDARIAGAYGNTPDHIPQAKGVFFGYDFHLNATGAHLIEINTNAGGALLNALLLQSQRDVILPGEVAALDNLEQVFLEMFRSEWRAERGDAPLQTIAIVDEQPGEQFLYPEFVLAQRIFERAGITALIADPAEFQARTGSLYYREHKVDLIYNRMTDFFLQQHVILSEVYQGNQVVLTPHPHAYALYADKRNLALLTDPESLGAMGVTNGDISVLQAGIPQTRMVLEQDADHWWEHRKQWFFKPACGFGSKGTYRGANMTHRVFAEIMRGGYVAQHLALPGERRVCLKGAEPAAFKSDVRCYVYNGQVQLVAARLYQGQTTNFRTEGGGFAPARIVG